MFGEIGPIASKLVDFDKKTKKLYAFVCFENAEDTDRAIEKLNSRNLLNLNGNLYNFLCKFSIFLIFMNIFK